MRIGSIVIDRTRPELGDGMLLKLFTHPRQGERASVRFACGRKVIRRCDCIRRGGRPRSVERKLADSWGISLESYRRAMA